jgi:hypothetical protein
MITAYRELEWIWKDAVVACLRTVFNRFLGKIENSHGSQFRESNQIRELLNTKRIVADKIRSWFRIIAQLSIDYA